MARPLVPQAGDVVVAKAHDQYMFFEAQKLCPKVVVLLTSTYDHMQQARSMCSQGMNVFQGLKNSIVHEVLLSSSVRSSMLAGSQDGFFVQYHQDYVADQEAAFSSLERFLIRCFSIQQAVPFLRRYANESSLASTLSCGTTNCSIPPSTVKTLLHGSIDRQRPHRVCTQSKGHLTSIVVNAQHAAALWLQKLSAQNGRNSWDPINLGGRK